MARETASVLLGPGYFYTAPNPEAFPTLSASDTYDEDPGGNWADVGYSENGWNLVADVSFEFWTPAELVDPIAVIKNSQEIHIRGVAAQFTLETLQIALGGGSVVTAAGPPATKTFTPPESDEFDYFSALMRTRAPSGFVRDTRVTRAISVSSVDIPHNKGANPSLVAVDMRAMKEGANPIFDIVEVTA